MPEYKPNFNNMIVNREKMFRNLRKLFSKDIILRTVSVDTNKGKIIKIKDADSFIKKFKAGSMYERSRYGYVKSNRFGIGLSPQERRTLYYEYNRMEFTPEIARALDILTEECLGGDTIIPLLNGEKISIKELYERNLRDFWIYSIDKNLKFIAEKCERVEFNGIKEVFSIELDDGTIIKSTENHLWKTPEGKFIKTKNLNKGDSIFAINSKISTGKLSGYEMLKQDNKFKYTHRLVADMDDNLIREKKNTKYENYLVIHHKDFNKLNNCPDNMKYMDEKEHFIFHSKLQKDRWSNEEWRNSVIYKYKKSDESKKKYSIAAKKRWDNMSESEKENVKRRLKSVGMNFTEYNKKRNQKEENNTHYNHNKNRIKDIDINSYINYIKEGGTFKKALKEFNILRTDLGKLNNNICSKYSIKRIDRLKDLYFNNISIKTLREEINELIESDLNPKRNINKIMKKYDIPRKIINNLVKKVGYNTVSEFIDSNNHKVISVKKLEEKEPVFDLINVGKEHTYAIESNDGSKLYCHNCVTEDEKGDILSVTSNDKTIEKVLHSLFYDILNVETNLPMWIRNTLKYGDFGLLLDIEDKLGIINFEGIPAWLFERNDSSTDNKGMKNREEERDEIYFNIEGSNDKIPNYRFLHFRLLNDIQFLPYGRSFLEPCRVIWKQLTMLEDAMLVYRVTRAPDRRVYYIDVGNLPPDKVEQYINTVKTGLKHDVKIDHNTGNIDYRFTSMNMLEDIFIPVSGEDKSTKIEMLQGGENRGNIEDIEYIHCLRGNTKIKLLSGENKTIRELSEMSNLNNIETLSVNPETLSIEPVKILKAKQTLSNVKLIRIHLDNKEYVDCTYDHKFMLRNGSFIEAQQLSVGEFLMPLYTININVEKIEYLIETEDVYDIEVSKNSNFALECGIFVHNSKFLSALGIPKSYLSYEEDLSGKSSLSMEDVRFSRLTHKSQKVFIGELTKAARIHLYAQGFRNKQLFDFEVSLTNPSTVSEQLKYDLFQKKTDTFSSLIAGGMTRDFAYENIWQLNPEEIEKTNKKLIEDAKLKHRIEAIIQEGRDVEDEKASDEYLQTNKIGYKDDSSDTGLDTETEDMTTDMNIDFPDSGRHREITPSKLISASYKRKHPLIESLKVAKKKKFKDGIEIHKIVKAMPNHKEFVSDKEE